MLNRLFALLCFTCLLDCLFCLICLLSLICLLFFLVDPAKQNCKSNKNLSGHGNLGKPSLASWQV